MTPRNVNMWTGASSTSGNLQGVTYKPAATTYSGGLFANANCAPANSNRPDVTYGNAQEARENPPVFFRRALKIVDGASLNHRNLLHAAPTVFDRSWPQNPVYIQGDYNAPGGRRHLGRRSVAAAVEGDAVTFLSNNWNDVNSFTFRITLTTASRRPPRTAPRLFRGRAFHSRPSTDKRRTSEPTAACTTSCASWKTGADLPLPRLDGQLLLQSSSGRHL